MIIKLFVPLLFLVSCYHAYGQELKRSDITIGDKYSFNSSILNSTTDLFVGLPKNYHQANCRYPVHYILDGQIIFPYYFGVSDMLTKGEMPECIVVGIQSMKRGYYFKPGDGANDYTQFIKNELIPFIDSNYRTNNFRLILGHSTSGAFVVNTLLNCPELFDIFIAGAPYHSDMFLEEVRDTKLKGFANKKYFYSFYGHDDNKQEKLNWDSLSTLFKQKQLNNFVLINKDYTDEGHYSIVYRYIPDGLKIAFKDWGYKSKKGEVFSYSDFKKYSDYQKKKYNVHFDYSEGYFVGNAIGLSQKGYYENSIKLITHGLEKYPSSGVLHNIAATEYEKIGKTELAIKHYKRTLEISPDLEYIKQKLKELE